MTNLETILIFALSATVVGMVIHSIRQRKSHKALTKQEIDLRNERFIRTGGITLIIAGIGYTILAGILNMVSASLGIEKFIRDCQDLKINLKYWEPSYSAFFIVFGLIVVFAKPLINVIKAAKK